MDDFVIGGFSNYGDTFISDPSYNVKIRYDLFKLIPANHEINSILEIGCADGNNLVYLKNKYELNNRNVIGVDSCKLSLNKKNAYIKKSFDMGLNLIKKNKSMALINGPVSKTTFLKCIRCWKFEEEVNADEQLCLRCKKTLEGNV